MRMRIALSVLVAAIAAAVTIAGNVTAASADPSSLSLGQGEIFCC